MEVVFIDINKTCGHDLPAYNMNNCMIFVALKNLRKRAYHMSIILDEK